MNTTTAILLFARSAAAAAQEKQLLAGAAENTRLLAAMTARTKQLLQRSGLAFFHLDESRQQGETFGQRLAQAVQTVFLQGYQSLVVVGNDCPELSLFHLQSAAQQLAKGRCALGIDQRAGAYLIGLQAASFDSATFAALPWQTTELAAALTQVLAADSSLQLLPQLADVNQAADLWALSNCLQSLRWLAAFVSACSPSSRFWQLSPPSLRSCLFVAALPHRGPPRPSLSSLLNGPAIGLAA